MKFQDYTTEIFNFFQLNGIDLNPLPIIKIDHTENESYDPLIQTGYYNPDTKEITINVNNRQLKDILRTLCHELVHHHQNISQDKFSGVDLTGKLKDNKQLEELESEAYKIGNIMFRKWTESKK